MSNFTMRSDIVNEALASAELTIEELVGESVPTDSEEALTCALEWLHGWEGDYVDAEYEMDGAYMYRTDRWLVIRYGKPEVTRTEVNEFRSETEAIRRAKSIIAHAREVL